MSSTGHAIPAPAQSLIERARALRDDDRRVLAEARRAVDEAAQAEARRSAVEAIVERGPAYAESWIRIGAAYLPERLEELLRPGSGATASEVAEWQEVARLARLAIDDALLAFLTTDTIPPPAVRRLIAPWQAMLAAGHEREAAGSA